MLYPVKLSIFFEGPGMCARISASRYIESRRTQIGTFDLQTKIDYDRFKLLIKATS